MMHDIEIQSLSVFQTLNDMFAVLKRLCILKKKVLNIKENRRIAQIRDIFQKGR